MAANQSASNYPVSDLVARMGGSVGASAAPEGGVAFTVVLPVAP